MARDPRSRSLRAIASTMRRIRARRSRSSAMPTSSGTCSTPIVPTACRKRSSSADRRASARRRSPGASPASSSLIPTDRLPPCRRDRNLAVPPITRSARKLAAHCRMATSFLLRREWNEKSKRSYTEIRAEEVRQRHPSLSAGGRARAAIVICIVDCADDLNRHSANALLKLIEEPPPRSLFLIVANGPGWSCRLSVALPGRFAQAARRRRNRRGRSEVSAGPGHRRDRKPVAPRRSARTARCRRRCGSSPAVASNKIEQLLSLLQASAGNRLARRSCARRSARQPRVRSGFCS